MSGHTFQMLEAAEVLDEDLSGAARLSSPLGKKKAIDRQKAWSEKETKGSGWAFFFFAIDFLIYITTPS